jgi:hypothetical protein
MRIMFYKGALLLILSVSMCISGIDPSSELKSCDATCATPGGSDSLSVLIANHPCHSACHGIHSRGGKLLVASEHTLD